VDFADNSSVLDNFMFVVCPSAQFFMISAHFTIFEAQKTNGLSCSSLMIPFPLPACSLFALRFLCRLHFVVIARDTCAASMLGLICINPHSRTASSFAVVCVPHSDIPRDCRARSLAKYILSAFFYMCVRAAIRW